MKKKTKRGLLIALAVIALGTLIYFSVRQDKTQKFLLSEVKAEATYWENNAKENQAQVASLTTDLETLKRVKVLEIEKLEAALKEKPKSIWRPRIKSVAKISTETKDTVYLNVPGKTITHWDTLYQKHPPMQINHKDEWSEWQVTINRNHAPEITYSVRDSLSAVVSHRKDKLFSRRYATLDVISHNPKTIVTGLKHIRVEQKVDRVKFGVQIGVGLTLHGISPYMGVGGTFTF